MSQFAQMFSSMLATVINKQQSETIKPLEYKDLQETQIDAMYMHMAATYIQDSTLSER